MRIFLDNIEPKMLSKKFKVLQLYYRRSKTIMELVSNSGVYHIENNKFYKLKPVDKSIKKLEENIIVDESYYEKEQILSHIPTEHLSSLLTTFVFSFSEKAKLELHVEGYYKNIRKKDSKASSNYTHPLMKASTPDADLEQKYHYFVPTDFYFCIGKQEDKIETYLESIFFKKELNEWIEIIMDK